MAGFLPKKANFSHWLWRNFRRVIPVEPPALGMATSGEVNSVQTAAEIFIRIIHKFLQKIPWRKRSPAFPYEFVSRTST